MILYWWIHYASVKNPPKVKHKKWALMWAMCYAVLSGFSCVWLSVTPRTAAHQAPESLGFSRQEHWSGSPYPPPGFSQPRDPTPSPACSALAGGFFTTEPQGKQCNLQALVNNDVSILVHHLQHMHTIMQNVKNWGNCSKEGWVFMEV